MGWIGTHRESEVRDKANQNKNATKYKWERHFVANICTPVREPPTVQQSNRTQVRSDFDCLISQLRHRSAYAPDHFSRHLMKSDPANHLALLVVSKIETCTCILYACDRFRIASGKSMSGPLSGSPRSPLGAPEGPRASSSYTLVQRWRLRLAALLTPRGSW